MGNFIVNSFLNYIDPGTGSMLLTVILGLVTTMVFVGRGLVLKMKYGIAGGKIKEKGADKDPFVIYTDSKRYWNVFKPVCDEFEKREIKCRYLTASQDDPVFNAGYKFIEAEFIGEGNKGFVKLNMMRAHICLCTTPGLDVLQWKRSKDVDYYVHTHHAVGDTYVYRMFGTDFFDAILTTGYNQARCIRTLEAARNLPPKEIEIVGYTAMDSMKERYDKMEKVQNDITTVLCAPSWGTNNILNKYGENFIQKLIDTGYRIIFRPHPQSKIFEPELLKSLQDRFPENDMFLWNEDNDNFDVLSKADIMITDFSTVMFDYSFIFEKPFIYTEFSYDTAVFDAAWTDEKPWQFSVLDTLGYELKEADFDNLKAVIDETMASEKYEEGRKAAIEESWHHRGKAAELTVDYLVNKLKELTENDIKEGKAAD